MPAAPLTRKLEKPALAVVFLLGLQLLATSAFFPLSFLSVFDAKRVLELLLFSALSIYAVFWAPLRAATAAQLARWPRTVGIGLALFFSLGVASSLRLEHPAYPLADVGMLFVVLLLIPVTAASRDLSVRVFDRWAVAALAVTGLAVAIQEFTGFAAGWALGTEFSYKQALVHFAHPRFYNQVQTWCIPVLAALPFVFAGKRWARAACVMLLGLQWFLVIALAARGTALSLLIAMSFMALWLPAQRRSWLRYQVAGLAAGIIIYACILAANHILLPASSGGDFLATSVGRPMTHSSGRSMFWQLSMKDALRHPLLGTGPGHFACDHPSWLPAHPHSFPLRILGEWGMLAGLLLFTLASFAGTAILRRLKDDKPVHQTDLPLKAVLATSLMAGALHACLSGVMTMPASQVTMVLVGGWYMSLSTAEAAATRPPRLARFVPIAGMLAACALLAFAATEIPRLGQRTAYAKIYGPMTPRFWQDGRVCKYRYAPYDD